MVIELLPDVAPKTVAQIKTLARAGLLRRHAVPSRDRGLHGAGRRSDRHRDRRQQAAGPAAGGQPAPFRARRLRHGAQLASRTAATASSSSCSRRRPSLDGQYTIWGQVVSGMEYVDQIKRGDAAANGKVTGQPDRIVHMRVAADVK